MNEAVHLVSERPTLPDRSDAGVPVLVRSLRLRQIERATERHGVLEKITIDKSGVNKAVVVGMCADSDVDIETRQSKYLNNLIEQYHRAIKRVVRPMFGFKSFCCARAIVARIETIRMIKKG